MDVVSAFLASTQRGAGPAHGVRLVTQPHAHSTATSPSHRRPLPPTQAGFGAVSREQKAEPEAPPLASLPTHVPSQVRSNEP